MVFPLKAVCWGSDPGPWPLSLASPSAVPEIIPIYRDKRGSGVTDPLRLRDVLRQRELLPRPRRIVRRWKGRKFVNPPGPVDWRGPEWVARVPPARFRGSLLPEAEKSFAYSADSERGRGHGEGNDSEARLPPIAD